MPAETPQRRWLRQRRRRRRAQREHELFLITMMHQLRNAVGTLSLQAEVLVRQGAQPADELVSSLQSRLHQLGRFLERLEAGEAAVLRSRRRAPSAEFDLIACAREVLLEYVPVARQRQIDLGWLDEGGLPATSILLVRGDADAVREALVNVLDNAIAHSPDGARIDVSAGVTDVTSAWLKIADQGPGVSPKSRNQIFTQNFRDDGYCDATSLSSRGVGLFIAQRILRNNSANIRVYEGNSRPGTGSGATLVITLGLGKTPI